MITIQDMVQREVLCCMSSIVATLASGLHQQSMKGELFAVCDQASELASPIADYEEAAFQAGWSKNLGTNEWFKDDSTFTYVEDMCVYEGIDPIDREVYEHWAVSAWLAEKLQAHGEKVDTDFASLNVWARTTTGQAIHADSVIEAIYKEMME